MLKILMTAPCPDLTSIEIEMNKLIEAENIVMGKTGRTIIINTLYQERLWTVVFAVEYEM